MANPSARTVLRALIALGLPLIPALAVAEDGTEREPRWAPVVVDQGASTEQTLTLLNALATALRTQEQINLLDPGVAARRFEQSHSAAPVEVGDEKLRELGDGFRKALEAAALGQWDTAYDLVRSFDELSQPVQDYVTWKLNLSRDISAYCLMSVHFMLRAGREGAAREEMRNCFYSAPNRTPSTKDTPEDVIQLHAKVKTELLAQGEASLDVDISGAPRVEGCVVVVNGVPKGALPYREAGLLPVPMRVQVNCQRPGRIHIVRLKPGRNSLIVDLRFEGIVRTEGHVSLRYGNEREEQAAQVRDALTIANVLNATDLLLVRRTADGLVAFQRIGTQLEKQAAEVTIAPKASAEEIRTAAHSLVASRSGRIAGEDGEGATHDEARADAHPSLYGGIVIATGSATSLAIAWFAYAEAMRFRELVETANACELRSGSVNLLCIQSFAKYQTLGDFTWAFGGVGAALGVTAMPALLPETTGIPAWSWLVGGVGVAAAVGGIALWSNGDRCSLTSCTSDQQDVSLGQLVLLSSAPLLAVPLTHGIRSLLRTNTVQASASYLPEGGSIAVAGRF